MTLSRNPGNPLRRDPAKPLRSTTRLPGGGNLPRRVPMKQGPARRETATPRTAPRAKPGSVRAAVALVLAGEATCAQAARMCGLDDSKVPAVKEAAAREFRRLVMERDNWECQARLSPDCPGWATDVQHRQKRRSGGTSDPVTGYGLVNGVALCRADHDLADRRYDAEMHARGFWLESGEDPALVPLVVATEYGLERRWLLADGGYSLEAPEGTAAA